jgi:hypothetical protein
LPTPSLRALEYADDNEELGYLTHIVFRLIEFTSAQGEVSHRVRVSFSNGVNVAVLGNGADVTVTTGVGAYASPSEAKHGKVSLARQLPPASVDNEGDDAAKWDVMWAAVNTGAGGSGAGGGGELSD